MKVKFKEWNCKAVGMYYAGGNKAIRLIDEDDHEPIVTATVNLVDFNEVMPENVVFIKDYSENEGIVEALAKADIIHPFSVGKTKSGYVEINAYILTEEAMKELWQ